MDAIDLQALLRAAVLGTDRPTPNAEDRHRIAQKVVSKLWEVDQQLIVDLISAPHELDVGNALSCLINQHMSLLCFYVEAVEGSPAAVHHYLLETAKEHNPTNPAGPIPHNKWGSRKP